MIRQRIKISEKATAVLAAALLLSTIPACPAWAARKAGTGASELNSAYRAALSAERDAEEEEQRTEEKSTGAGEAAADPAPGITPEEADEDSQETQESDAAELREEVVEYALSFVGGRYVWGGNDPHTGADCSGFVRYVLSNSAGVSMSRSSRDQAREGRTVSAEEMQPGDLIFYGSGSSVNHVAMYIGDGKIVHASTEKSGIKVSNWNYKAPLRIASFLG